MSRFEYLKQRFHNQRPYWLEFVFSGVSFSVSYRVTISALSTSYIQISTNSEKLLHITDILVGTENEALGIELLKEPTFDTGTTPIPIINLDDRTSKTADTSIYSDPTNVSGGIQLFESYVPQGGAAKGGSVVGGINRLERILDYNTDYIFAITNEGNSATDAMVNMTFYESLN